MTDTKLKDPPPWARTRRWWLRALTEARAERDEALGRVDWWAIHARKLRAERDEAIEQIRQVRAQKLQAVKVLVGADECCGECRAISENEEQQHS